MTDGFPEIDPDDQSIKSIGEIVVDLIPTCTIAGILNGLHRYVRVKAAMLQAVESERSREWQKLSKLIDDAVDIAIRVETLD